MMTRREELGLCLALVQRVQLLDECLDQNVSRFEVHRLFEDGLGLFAELPLDRLKDRAKGVDTLSYSRRDLVV